MLRVPETRTLKPALAGVLQAPQRVTTKYTKSHEKAGTVNCGPQA